MKYLSVHPGAHILKYFSGEHKCVMATGARLMAKPVATGGFPCVANPVKNFRFETGKIHSKLTFMRLTG